MVEIAIANEQSRLTVEESRLRQAVALVLAEAKIDEATISIALVDDPTIHELNRRYLEHDYPTDVLSFVLERTERTLDGEIIASTDTAARSAPDYGWSAHDELLLYIIHGALHLVGYDDQDEPSATEMRTREREILARLGN